MVEKYRNAAEGTSSSIPQEANESHDRMHGYYKTLRKSDSGRRGISALMTDPSPHVRCWAAAHSLAWQPGIARAVLDALVNADGPCAFDAEITLREFREGRLTFDY